MNSIGALIGVVALILVLLVVVALVLLPRGRGKNRASRPQIPSGLRNVATSAPAAVASAPPVVSAPASTVEQLLHQGRKIEAIKLFREQTGAGLAEAKDAIENGSFASAVWSQVSERQAPSALPAEVSAEIDRLIASGSPIEAIKLLRTSTSLGLKEAKDAIDRWVPGSFG